VVPRQKIALASLIILCLGLAGPAQANCTRCHPGYRSPMPPQTRELTCGFCHKGSASASHLPQAHKGLIPNPSDLSVAPRTCGRCHPGQVRRVRFSPMATATGIINMTRFLWGAQHTLTPQYAVWATGRLKALPGPSPLGGVDDLLRRRCLRCHLWVKGADTIGARRSSGCAACHRPTDEAGRYTSGHRLVRQVPTSQCLRCHGECGAGRQAVGFIPRDEHASARFLSPDPWHPQLWQARTWRPMKPDVHIAAGMGCTDCHGSGDVMGRAGAKGYALGNVQARCTGCHGSWSSSPQAGERLQRRGERWVLITASGKSLVVPRFRHGPGAPVAHQVGAHEALACHACHSATNPAAWGMQVLLETRKNYELWAPIAAQGDPQVLGLITRQLARPLKRRRSPATRDYLSGRELPGMWLVAPLLRRYEWRVLVRGPQGRIMLASPRFQYIYCQPNRPAKALGWGLVPWNPHTTSAHGPRCITCHTSAMAAGLGTRFVAQGSHAGGIVLSARLWQPGREGLEGVPGFAQLTTLEGTSLQKLLVPGARVLERGQIRRLLVPPRIWHRWHLRAMSQQWPWASPYQAR